MKETLATIVGCFLMITTAAGQQAADSLLPEAIITAYGLQKTAVAVPAAVSTLNARDFQQSGEATPVLPFQKLPGVRLEERSPGSYRISIRGSSLRSPFGVRNVKVYWDNLPLTEANGNTSLNLLDVSLYQQVEVIRGPAASYYGAGTGGVINIGSLPTAVTSGGDPEAEMAAGSFSYLRLKAGYQYSDTLTKIRSGVTHMRTSGYRQHSSLQRQNAYWSSRYQLNNARALQTSLLLARIRYDIPGGLNAEQFGENPRQARAGSIAQNSSIHQQYAFLGVGQHYQLSDKIQNSTWLFGSASFLDHPFITDYKRDLGTSLGVRSIWRYRQNLGEKRLDIQFGGEMQTGYEVARNYGNISGHADTLNFEDEINTRIGFLFLQSELALSRRLTLTAGASFNAYTYHIRRLVDNRLNRAYELNKQFDPVFAPRLAASYQLAPALQLWGQMSKGFSPPSLEEIRTNEGSLNEALEAEKGTNYEIGLRNSQSGQLQWNIAAYYFSLQQTITSYIGENSPVTRFRNAGSARQYGLEAAIDARLLQTAVWLISGNGSAALQHYRFRQYQQKSEDYSGNALPGVAPFTSFLGLETHFRQRLALSAGYTYTSSIPLNDANSAYAPAFNLVQARLSYRPQWWPQLDVQFFVSGQNLLNEHYSLGYDLNAFGNRFYQPSPTRSIQAGIVIQP